MARLIGYILFFIGIAIFFTDDLIHGGVEEEPAKETVYVWMRTDANGHVELTDEDRCFPRIPPKETRRTA